MTCKQALNFKDASSQQYGLLLGIYLYMMMMMNKMLFIHVFENNGIICIAHKLKSPSLSMAGGCMTKGKRENVNINGGLSN